MVLLQTRGALASTNETLEATRRELATESERATRLDSELERLDGERSTAEALAAQLDGDLSEITERLDSAEQRVVDLEAARVEADLARQELEADLAERSAALSSALEKVEQQEADAIVRERENLDLTHETERLQVELVEAADEAAKKRAPTVPSVLVSDDGADLDVPGFSPAMAWELELVRSERTWRYSVAANPVEDPSPFDAGDVNTLKLAIEIEALALREDVGAFIGIDWQVGVAIDPVADPARAHLTLRLAQELLASAAREMSPSTMIVRSDPKRGGVSLEVVASDPNDVDFKIPPPPIASEWIGIDEHGGMVVTVKVD
jgi:hypothetical protein